MSLHLPPAPPWALWHRPAWRSLEWTRIASLSLFGVLLLYVLTVFREYGISNDEEVQHVYGQFLYRFYASGFVDHAAFHYKNLYLYGGFFDLIAATLEQLLPQFNVWDLRHLLSALFGLSGMYACWKLARLLAGEKAGIAAVVMLALTGAWSGGMFTHTKDVPFATCMSWALYYTVRIAPRLPAPPLRLVLKLGVAIGCAMGLRVGAVFAVFYVGLTLLLAAGLAPVAGLPARLAFFGRSLLALLPGAAVGLALMALFWPWAVMAPGNLLKAATAFSHFSFPMLTIVDGEVLPIGDVPADYLHQYLLVRLPLLLLFGVLCLPFALWRGHQAAAAAGELRRQWLRHFPLGLAILFPLAFTLLTDPALYNGLRHFTFVVPPIAIAAAIGLRHLWHACLHRHGRETLLAAVVLVLAADSAITLARLHPYEYVFYNRLAGGVPGAADEWELDYWSSSLREATAQLNAYVADEFPDGPPRPFLVAVCAEPIQAEAYLAKGLQVTRDWVKADFFLSSTQMNCHETLHGRIIGRVARMGVTFAVVRDRRELSPERRLPRTP